MLNMAISIETTIKPIKTPINMIRAGSKRDINRFILVLPMKKYGVAHAKVFTKIRNLSGIRYIPMIRTVLQVLCSGEAKENSSKFTASRISMAQSVG